MTNITKTLQNLEAKSNTRDGLTALILGIRVSSTPTGTVLRKIITQVHEKDYVKPYFVVTAYSEFFLEARKNPRFKAAMEAADMIVPDGVSVWQAIEYLNQNKRGWINGLIGGIGVGIKTLRSGYGERITGVKLTETLLKLAVQNKYKVFLLGGWGGVAERLAKKWQDNGLRVEWDGGFADIQNALTHTTLSKPVVEKINRFKPDLLFVSFGRFKQELWIHQQLKNLRAGMVMGVGSSFDELAKEGVWKDSVPAWVEKRGLKWLWRVTRDPKHIKRAWNASVVFAWNVYRQKIRPF